jgi:hypothetical protein
MSTTSDLQQQLNRVQRELADLKQESTINVGLLATAIRRSRLQLAEIEQGAAIARVQGPISLIDWQVRQGAFAGNGATSGDALANSLRAGGGGGEPAAFPTEMDLRDVPDIYDTVIVSGYRPASISLGSGSAPVDWILRRTAPRHASISGGLNVTGRLTRDGIDVADLGQLAAVSRGAGGMGPPGFDGADGEEGMPIPGAAGPSGATGATGPAGAPGIGLDGDTGEEGMPIPGNPGATGAAGSPGQLGPPGDEGPEGPEGMAIPGLPGPTGGVGLQGPPGLPGWDGSDGEDSMVPGPPGPPGTGGSSSVEDNIYLNIIAA